MKMFKTYGCAGVAAVLALFSSAGWSAGPGSPQGAISPAPAFSIQQLNQAPEDDWLTNGGSLRNQRYSPLKEINSSNVHQLKGVWLTHLDGSGVANKYSAEAQPLEYNGVIYVPTGADDVFAVSVETGKILWRYQAHLEQTISTICCGWLSRGVALGDGKVYIGQLNGKLVALDQRTGKKVWSTQAVEWKKGYSLTAAPLYVDGKVIIGSAGGEYGIRGRVMAFDAKSGKEVWRFYTIPGPGEPGHDTWPKTGDAWLHGGAPVWQTPSVDPELGLIYFSTGNAGPDYNGSEREGDNLYASSIVALDLKTGKYRWHFQLVHHDIWDYDAPSPTVLFDVTIDGKPVKGIGEAAKTGWLYLLDRTNGKPIYPIPETPVPQNANQKTSPTQPIPSLAPFATHVPTPEQVARVKAVAGVDKAIVSERIFTPFWKDLVVVAPGAAGGTNWPPSSYDPVNNLFFVCGQDSVAGVTSDTEDAPKRGANGAAGLAMGSTGALGNGFQRGLLCGLQRRDGQGRLGKALSHLLLLRLGDYRGQPGVCRCQLRRVASLRGHHRQGTLEVPDRRGRQQHGRGVPAQGQAICGVLRGRQRAGSHRTRRQPLAVRAGRHAGRSGRRQGRTRLAPCGRKGARTHARHATAWQPRRGGQGLRAKLRGLSRRARPGRQRWPQPDHHPLRQAARHRARARHQRRQGHAPVQERTERTRHCQRVVVCDQGHHPRQMSVH